MKPVRTCLLILALAAFQSHVFAQTTFIANITHDQEPGVAGTTPPTMSGGGPRPLAFGTAIFTLNAAMTSLSFVATIFHLDVTGTQTPNDTNDNLLNGHIHAGLTNGQPGTNASVVWGFFGAPLNDNNPNDFNLTPFTSAVGGVFSGKWDAPEGNGTTLAAQLGNIIAGRSYINFHTGQFGGGDIRGQLIVPDTGSTAALLGLGAAGLIVFRSRAQRKRALRA